VLEIEEEEEEEVPKREKFNFKKFENIKIKPIKKR